MHLVSDPDKYEEAVKRKFPFFRTACGSAVPNRDLTKDPTRVDCPLCRKMIEAAMGPPPPHPSRARPPGPNLPPDVAPVSTPSSFDIDDDLFDDLDDFDRNSSVSDLSPTPSAEPEASAPMSGGIMGLLDKLDDVKGMIDQVMPMLGMLTGDCQTEPLWKHWVDDDLQGEPIPAGALEDIRSLVPPSDLTALKTLYGFGGQFGLDPLFALFLSILHRQVVARAEGLDLTMEVDEDDPSEEADLDEDPDSDEQDDDNAENDALEEVVSEAVDKE